MDAMAVVIASIIRTAPVALRPGSPSALMDELDLKGWKKLSIGHYRSNLPVRLSEALRRSPPSVRHRRWLRIATRDPSGR